MDLQTFFENFETIAEAPGGIDKLRSLILDLAVQGKLVSQNPSDESAEYLLLENQSLILEAREGKKKKIPEGLLSSKKIPDGWIQCQLGNIALVEMGNSPPGHSYNDYGDGVPLINGPVEFSRSPLGLTVKTKFTTLPSRMCKKGDMLVCVRGATTGRTNIAAFDACIGRGVASVHGWAAQEYLNYLLWQLGDQLLLQGKGTTFPSISYADLAGKEILVPPLKEQKRIVAKIDELMALCDRLQAAQEKRDRDRQKLRASALDALMNAPTDEAFDQAWAFVRDRWDDLNQQPEDVKEMLQKIVDLGVQGKLIPHAENNNQLPEIKIDEKTIPLSKPRLWKWIYVKDLLERPLQNGRSVPTQAGGFPVLRLSALRGEYLNLSDYKNGAWTQEDAASWLVHKDDYFIARGNGSIHLVGRGALVKDEVRTPIAFPDTMIRMRISQDILSLDFLRYLWNSNYVRGQIETLARTTSGLFKVSQSSIQGVLLAVPSVNEQNQIVAKINAMVTQCNRLENSLRQSQEKASALSSAATSSLEV